MEKIAHRLRPITTLLMTILMLSPPITQGSESFPTTVDSAEQEPVGPVADLERWLSKTPMIDKDSRAVRRQVSELIAGAQDDRERAVRIFRFVRDEIEFGWEGSFYAMKASEVLRARRGFCNTKATLFIAMLRAAGILPTPRFISATAGSASTAT